MDRRLAAAVIALVVSIYSGATFALEVEVDDQTDLTAYETFGWQDRDEDLRDTDEELHELTVEIIRDRFEASGLQFVESDPQLWISYQAAETRETRFRSRYVGSMAAGTDRSITEEFVVDIGTLMIEVQDASSEAVVWRASGQSILSRKAEANLKKIEKMVSKMGRRWERVYKRD